jgi:(p)ppGpp synthase/HD superfamily hydrolase
MMKDPKSMKKEYVSARDEVEKILLIASTLAKEAHAGAVRRGSGLPYIVHPERVANRIPTSKKLGILVAMKSAAWLHDVLEDCPGWTASSLFDRLVRDGYPAKYAKWVVEIVNDLTKYPGKTWDASRISTPAKYIKLLDRIDNLQDGARHFGPKWLRKYLDESRELAKKLQGTDYLLETELRNLMDDLEKHLKKLEKKESEGPAQT